MIRVRNIIVVGIMNSCGSYIGSSSSSSSSSSITSCISPNALTVSLSWDKKLFPICFSAVEGFAWCDVSSSDDEYDCDGADSINPLADAIAGLGLLEVVMV